MIFISKCTQQDLPAVQELLRYYGNKCLVNESHINRRDISLQARLEDGKLVGFVFCGLMANKTQAYIDKATIHPDHHKQGILNLLYKELFKICYKLGVKEAFGIIRHDDYHNASCINALKMGFGADALSYTYVMAQLEHMKSELKLEI